VDAKVLGAVGALILVQLVLQIVAIVQLVKTPQDRVSIGGRKWAWALIILLGEIVGAILWFVLGKTAAPAAVTGQDIGVAEKRSAVDGLYGSPKE